MYICIYINLYIYRRANGIYIQKSCSIWTVCPCFHYRKLRTVDCEEKHYYVCSAPTENKLICPEDHFYYQGKCVFKGTAQVSLKEAKLTCAKRGGIVLPIKTKGMYRIIRQYSIAVDALDVFVGMNLTADVGLYTDNEIYDASSSYDFEGDSIKFADSPCVYLKRGITYKTRGISCEKTLEFYCLWKRKCTIYIYILRKPF